MEYRQKEPFSASGVGSLTHKEESMSVLRVENVSFSYIKGRQVLKNVSCSFETGKMYALIGKSGAGKSTLLSLLAGLDVPNEGDVLFEGVSTKNIDRNKYRRESVSVIYQDFSLFPGLTVLENIMYPMELAHINGEKAKAEAKTLAAKVALPENLLDRFPREISGGEQQRVAIARGLSLNRCLLLADEPTGNLDSENSKGVIDLLSDLAHNDNKCIVVVTHDPLVTGRADIVYKINDGIVTE